MDWAHWRRFPVHQFNVSVPQFCSITTTTSHNTTFQFCIKIFFNYILWKRQNHWRSYTYATIVHMHFTSIFGILRSWLKNTWASADWEQEQQGSCTSFEIFNVALCSRICQTVHYNNSRFGVCLLKFSTNIGYVLSEAAISDSTHPSLAYCSHYQKQIELHVCVSYVNYEMQNV